jgi:hypothetical protein
MREFAFFGTWNDSWAVLDAIEQLDMFWMVPDRWYERSEPLMCRHVDDSLKGMLRERRRLFLWSDAFAPTFPALRQQRSGPKSGYHNVPVGIGVPLLELVLPPCYEENDLLNVGAGDLAASQVVINPTTQREEPAPELLAGFELVRSQMKRVLTRHKLKRWIWIGPEALRLLQEQRVRITAPNA